MAPLLGVLGRSVVADIFILLAEGLTALLVRFFASPSKRGFSCADASIRLPYLPQTISTLALGLGFIVGGLVLMLLVELLVVRRRSIPSNVQYRGRNLPAWMVQLYRSSVAFLCGAGLSHMSTDIGKYHLGALRPHFWEVCQPSVDCGQRLDQFAYIQYADYRCTSQYSSSVIDEARVSFPSGHANISFYTSTFIVVYLQVRLACIDNSRELACFLIRPLLQGVALLAAWFITVSRVMDNMHHWRDVTAGGLLGTIGAILIILSIKPFREPPCLQPSEVTPLRQLETSTGENTNHCRDKKNVHAITIEEGRYAENRGGTAADTAMSPT